MAACRAGVAALEMLCLRCLHLQCSLEDSRETPCRPALGGELCMKLKRFRLVVLATVAIGSLPRATTQVRANGQHFRSAVYSRMKERHCLTSHKVKFPRSRESGIASLDSKTGFDPA